MMKSGRAMYNWPAEDGGIPPTFDSINDETSRNKVHAFVENLLGHHQGISRELKYLLAANGVRLFRDYVQVLKDDPIKKGRNLSQLKSEDIFTNKIFSALRQAEISTEEFSDWQKDVTLKFKIDNFTSHANLFNDSDIKDMPLLGNWCFQDFCTTLRANYKNIMEENSTLKEKVGKMEERLIRMESTLNESVKMMHATTRMLMNSGLRLQHNKDNECLVLPVDAETDTECTVHHTLNDKVRIFLKNFFLLKHFVCSKYFHNKNISIKKLCYYSTMVTMMSYWLIGTPQVK